MTDDNLIRLRSRLDALAQTAPDDGMEFWYARDLLKALGDNGHVAFMRYARRAAADCEAAGNDRATHFHGVMRTLPGRKNDEHPQRDFRLSRYACRLVVLNIDSRRDSVVFAREYFTAPVPKETQVGECRNDDNPDATGAGQPQVANTVTPPDKSAPRPASAPQPTENDRPKNAWQAALQQRHGNAGHGSRFIPTHGGHTSGQLNPGGNPRINRNLAVGRGHPNGAARTSK